MRFIRILAGVALFAIAISFVLIVILGRSVDRDRDTSLTSMTDPVAAQLTPTVTLPGSDSVLVRGTVEHVSDGDTVRIRIGSTVETVRLIGIDAPEIADNGNTVPVGINVYSPMTADDHVASVLILAAGNPRPGVATFHFSPLSGAATAQTRMRLAKTQDIVAIAKMSDGSVFMDKRTVKVTIGGCGG